MLRAQIRRRFARGAFSGLHHPPGRPLPPPEPDRRGTPAAASRSPGLRKPKPPIPRPRISSWTSKLMGKAAEPSIEVFDSKSFPFSLQTPSNRALSAMKITTVDGPRAPLWEARACAPPSSPPVTSRQHAKTAGAPETPLAIRLRRDRPTLEAFSVEGRGSRSRFTPVFEEKCMEMP